MRLIPPIDPLHSPLWPSSGAKQKEEKPSRALAPTFPVHQQNIDAFLARRAA